MKDTTTEFKSRKVCAKIFVSQNLVKAIIWGGGCPTSKQAIRFCAAAMAAKSCEDGNRRTLYQWNIENHQMTTSTNKWWFNGDLMVI